MNTLTLQIASAAELVTSNYRSLPTLERQHWHYYRFVSVAIHQNVCDMSEMVYLGRHTPHGTGVMHEDAENLGNDLRQVDLKLGPQGTHDLLH